MTPYLLVDFGTSSTKSVLVDLDTGVFHHPKRYGALPRLSGKAYQYETSLVSIRNRFEEICHHYRTELEVRMAGIVICSEMHGFALADESGRPATEYIGWLDERSAHPAGDGPAPYSEIRQRLAREFRVTTGMRPRPGFAILNLVHLARSGPLPNDLRVLSLPCWLSMTSGDSRCKVHDSMLAGMGFYDINDRSESAGMQSTVEELTGRRFLLNELATEHEVSGYWHHAREKLPIYTGVGDHQCALLGAGNRPNETISINLGTGSQVSVVASQASDPDLETRPFFGTDQLKTITHIPGGRALAEYIGFLEEVSRAGNDVGGSPDYWAMLADIDEDSLRQASLSFDLAILRGARGFADGGAIGKIKAGELTLANYLGSLLNSFLQQYVEVVDVFDPACQIERCILSGGVARNLPHLTGMVRNRLRREVLPATSVDESLLGLRSIALMADGRADTYLEAMATYGRTCSLVAKEVE
jgi:sedoheptulokinase